MGRRISKKIKLQKLPINEVLCLLKRKLQKTNRINNKDKIAVKQSSFGENFNVFGGERLISPTGDFWNYFSDDDEVFLLMTLKSL